MPLSPEVKAQAGRPTRPVGLHARDVAKYFLALASAREDDSMTNMKLQKLLYYAQGFHLAIFDRPLFSEPVCKWVHGPVVPEVYHAYKQYGSACIPAPEDVDYALFSEETTELLDEVYEVYGQYTASVLRGLTHSEPPWCSTPDGGVVSHEVMSAYFKTQVQ